MNIHDPMQNSQDNPFLVLEKRLLSQIKSLLDEKLPPPQKSSDDKRLVTQQQLLKQLNISLPTLIEWRKKGFIKAHRIGSRIFYKEEEIRAALIEKDNL